MAARSTRFLSLAAAAALCSRGATAVLSANSREYMGSVAYNDLMEHLRTVNNSMLKSPEASTSLKLLQQLRESGKMAYQNMLMGERIVAMQHRNRVLRLVGDEARQQIGELTTELRLIQSQLTEGKRYVADALKLATEHDAGSELLRELSEKDADLQRAHDMQNKFAEIEKLGTTSRRGSSLLQQSSEMDNQLVAVSQESFAALNRNLDQLMKAARASTQTFDAELSHQTEEVANRRSKLLQEQAALRNKDADAIKLHQRLTKAVEHMKNKEQRLRASLGALQLMVHRFIGGATQRPSARRSLQRRFQAQAHSPDRRHLKEAFSLLQSELSTAHAEKRDDIDTGSAGAFHSVASRVEQLQAQLTSMEINNKRQQARRKHDYETRLATARNENLQVASENARVLQGIQELKKSTISLKTKAFGLKADVQSLQEDWESLESNFSTALEVTSKVLAGVKELDKAPELRVLEELNERDRGLGETEQARHRFDEILGAALPGSKAASMAAKFALLQVATPGAPGSLLAALESGLQELSAENERALHGLDKKYRALLKDEEDRHAGLLAEQAMLQKTRSAIGATANRLQFAIDHLRSLSQNASQEAASVRAYFAQVGGRALPVKSVTEPQPQQAQTTSTTTTVASMQKSQEDPDKALFELESLLSEPSSPALSPAPASTLAFSAETRRQPTSQRKEAEVMDAEPGNKKWLSWLTR